MTSDVRNPKAQKKKQGAMEIEGDPGADADLAMKMKLTNLPREEAYMSLMETFGGFSERLAERKRRNSKTYDQGSLIQRMHI